MGNVTVVHTGYYFYGFIDFYHHNVCLITCISGVVCTFFLISVSLVSYLSWQITLYCFPRSAFYLKKKKKVVGKLTWALNKFYYFPCNILVLHHIYNFFLWHSVGNCIQLKSVLYFFGVLKPVFLWEWILLVLASSAPLWPQTKPRSLLLSSKMPQLYCTTQLFLLLVNSVCTK